MFNKLQERLLCVLTPCPNHFTRINLCCSTHLFYSINLSPKLFGPLTFFCCLIFWSTKMSMDLLPWLQWSLISRTGPTVKPVLHTNATLVHSYHNPYKQHLGTVQRYDYWAISFESHSSSDEKHLGVVFVKNCLLDEMFSRLKGRGKRGFGIMWKKAWKYVPEWKVILVSAKTEKKLLWPDGVRHPRRHHRHAYTASRTSSLH